MAIIEPQPQPELSYLKNSYNNLRSILKRVGFDILKRALQSDNFETGVSGWRITAEGDLEANDGTFRGAITATSGTISGSLIIGSNGLIRSGQTDYDTGTGFWIGNAGGTPKLSIGVGGSTTSSLTFDGTDLSLNGKSISDVVDGATTDINFGLFRGSNVDGLTEAVGNATITRKLLTTSVLYSTAGSWSLKSGTLGFKSTVEFNFENDIEYFVRLQSDTGLSASGGFAGKAYFWGLSESGGTNIPAVPSSILAFVRGRVLHDSHVGFIVDWDDNLFATSGSGLSASKGSSQDITDLSGVVTHTIFNNYRIETSYAAFPSISNTGFIRPTASSGTNWSNQSNAYDADTNTYAQSDSSNNARAIYFSWDAGTTWTQGQLTNLTASKTTVTIGGQYNTFGRTWSASDFSDANFVVKICDVTAIYADQQLYPFNLTTFGFSTGTWEEITGIEIELTGDANGDSGSPFIYDIRAKIYYTTTANTGYVKYYVNDTLVATHTSSIPRSTDTPIIHFGSKQGVNTSSSRHIFYNNYRVKIL